MKYTNNIWLYRIIWNSYIRGYRRQDNTNITVADNATVLSVDSNDFFDQYSSHHNPIHHPIIQSHHFGCINAIDHTVIIQLIKIIINKKVSI